MSDRPTPSPDEHELVLLHVDPGAPLGLPPHPEAPDVRRPASVIERHRPRRRVYAVARAGLLVAVVSAVVSVPALSSAEESTPPVPVVTLDCPEPLGPGPERFLPDGTPCVLPEPEAPLPKTPPPVDEEKQAEPPAQAPEESKPEPPEESKPEPPEESKPEPPPAPEPPEPAPAARPEQPKEEPAPPAAAPAPLAQTLGDATTSEQQPPGGEVRPSKPSRKKMAATPKQRSSRDERRTSSPERRRAARQRRDREERRAERRERQRRRPAIVSPAPEPAPAQPFLGQEPTFTAPMFEIDTPTIPRFLIRLYKHAAKRYDVPWEILAAINEIETDYGRNVAISSAGAMGWMQFMPATWRAYGVDGDRDGVKDPDNPSDAIHAAGRYLKASGAERNLRKAIFAYNHANWYVESVLIRAERIGEAEGRSSRRLRRVLRKSQRQLERRVLNSKRIHIYECGRQDIAAHRIDRRVLVLLELLATAGLHPTVTSLECGHGIYTSSGNVSHHSVGSAVDIGAINGVPITPATQGPGSITDATIREILTLKGNLRPDQIISLMTFEGRDNTFAMSDHHDHIHVGFEPITSRRARR